MEASILKIFVKGIDDVTRDQFVSKRAGMQCGGIVTVGIEVLLIHQTLLLIDQAGTKVIRQGTNASVVAFKLFIGARRIIVFQQGKQ